MLSFSTLRRAMTRASLRRCSDCGKAIANFVFARPTRAQVGSCEWRCSRCCSCWRRNCWRRGGGQWRRCTRRRCCRCCAARRRQARRDSRTRSGFEHHGRNHLKLGDSRRWQRARWSQRAAVQSLCRVYEIAGRANPESVQVSSMRSLRDCVTCLRCSRLSDFMLQQHSLHMRRVSLFRRAARAHEADITQG